MVNLTDFKAGLPKPKPLGATLFGWTLAGDGAAVLVRLQPRLQLLILLLLLLLLLLLILLLILLQLDCKICFLNFDCIFIFFSRSMRKGWSNRTAKRTRSSRSTRSSWRMRMTTRTRSSRSTRTWRTRQGLVGGREGGGQGVVGGLGRGGGQQ